MVDCGGLHVYLSGNRYGGLSNPYNIIHAKHSHIVRGTPNVQRSFPVCFLLPLWAYRKPSMVNYEKNVFNGWLVPGFSQSFMTLIDVS